jgi:hypothetical protein
MMSVVINEFEILVDPPGRPTSDAGGPPPQIVAPLRPEEVARNVRHYEARRRRVEAD